MPVAGDSTDDSKGGGRRGERNDVEAQASLVQTFANKFLCGASSIGDTLRMIANAGHHCDEDHVGLYVADSNSRAGSSITTLDAMR